MVIQNTYVYKVCIIKTWYGKGTYNFKKAKALQLNISGEVNKLLRDRIIPKKSDLPDKLLILKCTQCFKEIEYGFYCAFRDLFLCQACQDKFNMSKCPHDARGEHMHIRVPGFEGQNTEYLKYGQKEVKDNSSNAESDT